MAIKLGRSLATAVVVLGAVIAAVSCAKTDTGTDSNTHWMHSCEEDTECGILKCLCGVCTKSCSESSACSSVGNEATCGSLDACGSGSGNVCVPGSGAEAGSGGAGSGGQAASGGNADGGGAGGAGATTGSGGSEPTSDAPSGGCSPMDVSGNVNCRVDLPVEWHWDGTHCVPTRCCSGADCSRRYDSVEACDAAHAQCYTEHGVSRACVVNTDCALTERSCCFCGQTAATDVIAVSESSVASYDDLACSSMTGECPPCVPIPNPALVPVCVQRECKVLDIEPFTLCEQDEDCRLEHTACCCGDYAAVSADDSLLLPFREAICPAGNWQTCAMNCPEPQVRPICSEGRCTALPLPF